MIFLERSLGRLRSVTIRLDQEGCSLFALRRPTFHRAGYCQLDVTWTKLARVEPFGQPRLLREGSAGCIMPGSAGVLARSPILAGGKMMAAELEVVVDRSVSSKKLLRLTG
jgi:hypothetical protein